jgi:hypothetical protein
MPPSAERSGISLAKELRGSRAAMDVAACKNMLELGLVMRSLKSNG